MQTARVTILMTPAKKAAFDSLASARGLSTGEFFRQAGDRAAAAGEEQIEEALALAVPQIEEAVSRMNARLDEMRASVVQARDAIDKVLEGDE